MPFHSTFLQVDLSVFNPFGNLPKALRRLGFSLIVTMKDRKDKCTLTRIPKEKSDTRKNVEGVETTSLVITIPYDKEADFISILF